MHQPVSLDLKIGLDCYFGDCDCTEPCETIPSKVCLQCSWGKDLDYLPILLAVKWPCEGEQDVRLQAV